MNRTAEKWRVEHVQQAPAGWKIKPIKHPSGHEVRLAFPPGKRKKGSGRVIEILHPHGENPESCSGPNRHSNPSEILIMGLGNPRGREGKKNPKVVTYDQAKAKQDKAIDFLERIDADDPNDIAGMSVQEYADHKGLKISGENPKSKKKTVKRKAKTVSKHRKNSVHVVRSSQLGKTVFYIKGKDFSGAKVDRYAETQQQARRIAKEYSEAARRQRRKNAAGGSMEQAEKLYEKFQGKPPEEIRDLAIKNEVQKNYTYLGEFSRAGFVQDDGEVWWINFEGDGVKLAASPDGNQLYLIGGNQNILPILRDRGVDTSKDLISIGRCYCLYYVAAKSQTNFELTEWEHYLGCVEQIKKLLQDADSKGWTNAEFQVACR